MASEAPTATSDGVEETDLAKAFQELARGERTATALENQLTAMEAKIEALLQEAEQGQQELQRTEAGSHKPNGNETKTGTNGPNSRA